MKKKKGFTLIELLAVIIILAVIALIATPIVLDVIKDSTRQANKNSVYGLLDGAKLYYTESLLDTDKSSNINGTTNLIDLIKISGKKPDSGEIYINDKGQTALAVVYDDVCYKKDFTENDLKESEDVDNCKITSTTQEVTYKCKRADASTLHTEECTHTEESLFCSGAGYTADGSKGTTTIIYGNETITPGTLTSGDAFDCDVNGDGEYDSVTERFYYVSDLYNTTTNEFDSNYAVLIYYNNTTAGVPGSSIISYDDTHEEKYSHGPITAITALPTTSQWSNVSLSNTTRAIVNELGGTEVNSYDESGNDTVETLPTAFSYEGYAARLLTYQEIEVNCDINGKYKGTFTSPDLCEHLIENTYYSGVLPEDGYWLETPGTINHSAYSAYSTGIGGTLNSDNTTATRPAIEVLKTDIQY